MYSYGMISTSTLHMLDGSYPEPDGYAEIKGTYRMTGGEAANSSIVLSKLGIGVKLDGNWVGKDSGGLNTLRLLQSFKLDASRLEPRDGYRGVEEIVIADSSSRTILGTYVGFFNKKQWNDPVESDILKARIVCLDPFFGEESAYISRVCRKAGIPFVTVDCEYTHEIAQNADVVIISGEYRKRTYAEYDKEELLKKYTSSARGLVIFTSGDSDVIYSRKDGSIRRTRPFAIQPVDTAGAGDSFRSGIIYGMLKGWPEERSIKFACGLAAYICESFPGVLNCPEYDELVSYIKSKITVPDSIPAKYDAE